MLGSWLETMIKLISVRHASSSTLYPKYDITKDITKLLIGVNSYDVTITLVNGGPGVAKGIQCEVMPLNSKNKDECKNDCLELELEMKMRSNLFSFPALAPNESHMLWKGSCDGEASFMVKVRWRNDVPEWLPYFGKKYASESFCFDKFGNARNCDECVDLLKAETDRA